MYNYVDYLDDDDIPVITDEDESQGFRRSRSQILATAVIGDEDDED